MKSPEEIWNKHRKAWATAPNQIVKDPFVIEAMKEYANQFKEENERLRAKAEKWDALESEIGKFYEDDSDADLGDIGEAAAVAFGYL
jgi:hypothetical protein